MLIAENRFDVQLATLAVRHPRPTAEPPRDVWTAREQECASLATLKKYLGESAAIAFVARAVSHYAEMTNVQAGLTNSMTAGIARSVIRKYYFLTCNDILLALRMMVEGDWGPLYAKLDMTSVLEAVRQYADLKQDIARQHGMSGQAADFEVHPKVENRFRQIREQLEKTQREKARKAYEERVERGQLPGPWFSIKESCDALGIDYEQAVTNLQGCFESEWKQHGGQSYAEERGVDFRLFCNIRASEWLAALNKHYHPSKSNPSIQPS